MPEGAGGPAIHEAAYDTYADHVYAYAFTLVGSPEAAEDAAARAFRIALDRDLSLPRDEFRLRLYQLTRTECLTADSDGASFGRELFELHERHGLSPADIATIVGQPEDAVRETLEYGDRPPGLRATAGKAPATLRRRVLSTAPTGFLASTFATREVEPAPPPLPPRQRRRFGWVWAAVGVVAFALLGVGLASLLTPDQEGERDATPRPTLSVTLGAEQPEETLTTGPTSTLSPAPATPTSTTRAPTPTPKPSPTSSPTPTTPSPTPSPKATLAVSPASLTLGRRGGDARGTVTVTASGGPVSWSASASDGNYLKVSPASGVLQPGQSATVTIAVKGNPPGSVTQLSVVFRPGAAVTITLR